MNAGTAVAGHSSDAGPPPRPPGGVSQPDAWPEADAGPGSGSSRRGRLRVLALCLALVCAFAALSLLGAFAGRPGGPPSSSYSTSSQGVAAWAALLARTGRQVRQLRAPLSHALLSPGQTVVLLEPDALLHSDGARLMAFVRSGGRLLYGSSEPEGTLHSLLYSPPTWSSGGSTRFYGRLGGAAGTSGATVGGAGPAGEVRTAGEGRWVSWSGYRAPLLGSGGGALLLERVTGKGTLALLGDVSPVQNRLLGTADNARLALDLAGPRAREVVFVESVHGYGQSRGLAALPLGWKFALCGLALAGVLWVLARGRRLGPPERIPAEPVPPRSAYADALAGLLRRTDDEQAVKSTLDRWEEPG